MLKTILTTPRFQLCIHFLFVLSLLVVFYLIKKNFESSFIFLIMEDGLLEYLQFIFYFLAGACAFYSYKLLRQEKKLNLAA